MRWLLSILLLCGSAFGATNIYFAQTAQGGNTGLDCADAYAYSDATHGINGSQTASWTGTLPINIILCTATWTGSAAQVWVSTNGNGSTATISAISESSTTVTVTSTLNPGTGTNNVWKIGRASCRERV